MFCTFALLSIISVELNFLVSVRCFGGPNCQFFTIQVAIFTMVFFYAVVAGVIMIAYRFFTLPVSYFWIVIMKSVHFHLSAQLGFFGTCCLCSRVMTKNFFSKFQRA